MSLIIAQLKALRKVGDNIRKIVKHNGGIKGTYLALAREDEVKHGELVGEDEFGNKYYQNNDYMYLRNRWVSFSNSRGYDYDASHIPPEWHKWMHHGTDLPPSTHPRKFERWQTRDDPGNKTGTYEKYVAYSTTEPKIESWTPPKK